ncbi:ubiquitin conjugating enzyme family protein [Irpex rosettiformis]|uniref:Ubiquitin conjugating enzyme family protein n=1 Tax=Irpex rosettiformis TaxID=378272 RepID=A0ACB8UCU7_9APHY|nr:ubiquitin conjugating enzyme family protein [Irpex rosettiformis]
MNREVRQLVEMGATPAQARAALRQYKDVEQAAERFFEGAFDHITDGSDDEDMGSTSKSVRKAQVVTPDPEDDGDDAAGMAEDSDGEIEEDDDENEYMDYDSDYEVKVDNGRGNATADPYAGIFFSKDRREEVIEVEEEPETVFVPDANEQAKLLTQGQWMKGCPEGGEQSFLFGLYSELSEGSCSCPHGCGKSVRRNKRDFFAICAEFSTYITHLQKIVPRKCEGCGKHFCFACGESMTQNQLDENECLFHCANLQGAILGVGLTMLEKYFLEESGPAGDVPDKPINGKRRKAPAVQAHHGADIDDDDDSYPLPSMKGKKAKLGIGYAGEIREDNTGQLEAQAIQKAKDQKLSALLASIRVYLPSLHREGGGKPSDYLPHPTTLAHLRRRFNYVSSQLLRNDSLVDMSERSVLYFELFEWMETISCHEALASMMAMPIMVVSSVKNAITRRSSSRTGPQVRERTIIYEGSSGPRELLEAIVIQAQAAIKGLEPSIAAQNADGEMTEEQKRMTQDDKGKGKQVNKVVLEENVKLLEFCKRILANAKAIDRALVQTKGTAFVERLHASLPKIPGTSSSNGGAAEVQVGVEDSEEEVQRVYVDWANRVRFEYCDLTVPQAEDAAEDEALHYKFYYNAEARMLANSDIPKRSLAIAKELAVLTTNLPVAWSSSIFLRVDETRVDVIKALITGPEGTPYSLASYLFDIFLGPSYNQTPPSVKYMTTNGGKFRFNPNLYADGKVCLSLLGTWQGPGWVAGRSTLLQVLISIQSMILCDEPYLNEPGWADCAGTPQSKQYSANVRRMVVRTAVSFLSVVEAMYRWQMLGNLKNPPEPFEGVIRTHFRLKARSIMKQLDDWLALDDGRAIQSDGMAARGQAAVGSSQGLLNDVSELKGILQRLSEGGSVDGASAVAGGSGPTL